MTFRTFCFGTCTDGTTVGANTKPVPMTPVVSLCLSLQEDLREVFTLMYLAATFPKRAKDPIFLTPIADMFAELQPGGSGIDIDNNGKPWFAVKAWRVDDLGGIAGGIRSKQHGAYCGTPFAPLCAPLCAPLFAPLFAPIICCPQVHAFSANRWGSAARSSPSPREGLVITQVLSVIFPTPPTVAPSERSLPLSSRNYLQSLTSLTRSRRRR